jgi:hypothetical protein
LHPIFAAHMETYAPGYTAAAQLFTATTEELCRVITRHAQTRFVGRAMLLLIWNRALRLTRLFARLAERVRTDTLSERVRTRSGDASVRPVDAAAKPYVAPAEILPHHFRWLVNMIPELEPFGADLCSLLERLEMKELIHAAPRQAGRILRPMCKMLGVEPTAPLRLPIRVPVPRTVVEAEPEVPSDGAGDDGAAPLVSVTEAEVWEFDLRKRA